MIKYNLKHLWSDHKLFVSVVGVVLLIATII